MESQTPLTISAEYGLIDQNKFFGKRIAAKDLSNYYLIQKGEFAYNKSTSNDAPWGAIKRLDCYNNGALSTLYIVFKIKDNKSCYSDFLVTYYGTSLWHKGVKEIATEGARNHGLLNVSPSDFFRTKLVIPQDFEEQRKIGAFFTQLDNTITLQQRKLNSLQKLKKGLLQKMFPKKGENIPEIRFPEFSDAWKQRKVGDLLVERREMVTEDNEYPLMAFIANEGVAPKGDRFDRSALVKNADSKKYKRTKYGDFIYSSNNLESGSIGLNKYGKASISPVYSIFYPTNLADSDFIGRYFLRKDFIGQMIRWRQGVVYGQWKIPEADFLNIDIYIPSKDEQEKIGQILDKVDNTITLQQRKLESLQKLKKGLLQQMFI